MLCASCDLVQVVTSTKSLYKLQLVHAVCTSCNSYKIGCTSCNLYRILPSDNPNLQNTVIQVGFKKEVKLFTVIQVGFKKEVKLIEFTKNLEKFCQKHLKYKRVINICILIYEVGTLSLKGHVIYIVYHASKIKLLCYILSSA